MIRLGVMSDTHRQLGEASKAIGQMGEIDYLLHGGDHYEDALDLSQEIAVPIEAVVGNCDWRRCNGPHELLLEYAGVRLFLTHGHRYRVRFGYDILVERTRELGAQVAVVGHTHQPMQLEQGGVLIFNPGSIALPRGGSKPSFGIITIHQGKIQGEIVFLEE